MQQLSLYLGQLGHIEHPPADATPGGRGAPIRDRQGREEDCEADLVHTHVAAVQAGPADSQYGPGRLKTFLQVRLRRPVQLVLTNNRVTMLSYRDLGAKGLYVRLHQMFGQAPAGVLEGLATYLESGDRDAWQPIKAFIAAQRPQHSQVARVRTRGQYHDLSAIFDRLNATYFHRACSARITWGRAGRRRRRRSIQLGCYVADDQLIRIHPCLDQSFVPEYYVAWVVFHEMLHEVFGVEERSGQRRVLHSPEFTAIEESYPDYARCKAWEAANMHRLLAYRARG